MADESSEPKYRDGPFSQFKPPQLIDRTSSSTDPRDAILPDSTDQSVFRPPSNGSSYTSEAPTQSVGSHEIPASMPENRGGATQYREILPNGVPLEDIRPETWQYLSHPYNEQPASHQRQESRESYASSASEDMTSAQAGDQQLLPSIKELICPHCSRVFLDNRTLRTHVRTHVQGRPYTCDICGATFSRLHDLERHTMIHTGERPHICDMCGRRFARAYTMSRHKNGNGGCAGRRAEKRVMRSQRHSASPGPAQAAQVSNPPAQTQTAVSDPTPLFQNDGGSSG